jgi:fructose-1,6-bisphosphatase I
MLAEQAGGKATYGTQRLLDIKAQHIHQRTPLFTGSKNMMKMVLQFLK